MKLLLEIDAKDIEWKFIQVNIIEFKTKSETKGRIIAMSRKAENWLKKFTKFAKIAPVLLMILTSCAAFPDGKQHLWRKDYAVEIVKKSISETYFIGYRAPFSAEVLPDGTAKATCQEIKTSSGLSDWLKTFIGIGTSVGTAAAGREKTINKTVLPRGE